MASPVRRVLAAAAVATVSLTSSTLAFAQYNWSGIYIGGHAGHKWSNVDWTHLSAVPHFNPIGTNVDSFDLSGLIAGGHVGLNYQMGSFVVGLEGAISGGKRGQSVTRPGTFSPNEIRHETRSLLTGAVRIGWAMDRALAYGKVGYASARTSISLTEAPFFDDTFSAGSRMRGWLIGAGIEWAVSDDIVVGVEYDYLDLESKTFSGLDTGAFAVTTISVDPDPIHALTVRASLKLGNNSAMNQPLK